MYVFKNLNQGASLEQKNVVHYTHNFVTSSDGIQSIKIVSGSLNTNYWNSLNVLFYASGSPRFLKEHKFEKGVNHCAHLQNNLTKYHGYPSSSLFTIGQQYYGERIKPKSFKFTDLNNPDNDGNNPIIIDDGKGNLYSTNAHHSQSITAASSSDNYVGNIFYEHGIAVISETGSWSGSVNYSDLGTNYEIELDSHNTIITQEYMVTIRPGDFNHTMNHSVRMPVSGNSFTTNTFTSSRDVSQAIYISNLQSNPYLAQEFTGSTFQPYITSINLYQNGDYDTPVIIANLPKPIRVSNKIPITFKIKLDM
tara:strand:+ start:275 stop:1198 length:924 start_codon:yes stop_codon:yes gene_type:complete